MLIALLRLIDDGGGMHRLTRTIDGTIGIDLGPFAFVISLVVTIAVAEVHLRQGLVAVGIGKHLYPAALGILKKAFALTVGPEVMGVIVLIRGIDLEAHIGLGHWLTRCGTDHHIPDLISRSFFRHHKQVGDVIHPANDLCSGLRTELEHIHADGQALQRQTVLENLIVGLAGKGIRGKRMCHADLRHELQQGLQFLIVLARIGIQVQVAVSVHPIHLHLQLRKVAHFVQIDGLLTHRQGDATVDISSKLRIRQRPLGIFKDIDTAPARPFLRGLAHIPHLLLSRKLLFTTAFHIMIAADGQLATLGQVTINLNQRV